MNEKLTLASHFSKLSKRDKLLILNAVKMYGKQEFPVHLGNLPFLSAADVIDSVAVNTLHGERRLHAALLVKLRSIYCAAEPITLYLLDRKVYRICGSNPELGVTIPGVQKKRVTVGVKWSLPKRDFIPDDDVLVEPHMMLRRKSLNIWRVYCDAKYLSVATRYLTDTCM